MQTESTTPHWSNGLAAMNAGKPLAALNGDASSILQRLESESIKEISHSLAISQTALYAWLLEHAPEKWQAISTAIQLAKLTDAQDRFDDSDCDGLETARTREKAKIAMWQLSKTSKLYADKQDANSGINIQVVISNPLDQAHVVVDNPLNLQDNSLPVTIETKPG